MAKEKHPSDHEERVQQLLILSLTQEVLIPCQSRSLAQHLRRIFYSCARAHKIHATNFAEAFQRFRSRIYLSHDVIESRQHYDTDIRKFPFTLVIDNRELFEDNLNAAVLSKEVSPPPSRTPSLGDEYETARDRDRQREALDAFPDHDPTDPTDIEADPDALADMLRSLSNGGK